MRVAFIVTGGLHPSGREQVIPALLTLIERLAREHEVHAFALHHLRQAKSYQLNGATVHDLGQPRGRVQQWRALTRAFGRHRRFDVIHGYWIDPAGLLAAAVGRRFRLPSVVTCDSGEFVSLPQIDYGLQTSMRRRAVVSIATRLASVVHVSTAFMQGLARNLGIGTACIPIGVDVARVQFDEARAEGPPWRLLQVASLNPVKDQRTLLRSVAAIRRAVDVRLDVIGEDTLGGSVQREAAALGVTDAVTFHGFLPNDMITAFHRRAHLYVQSSLHEAAGVSVLEAAAAGVPIAGTRVGFVSDWDGRAAVAVPPGDHQSLARAVIDLLQRPGRRHELARAGRVWVEQHDANYTARAISDLYRSISGHYSGRPLR